MIEGVQHSQSFDGGFRRARRGPDYGHMRVAMRFLRAQKLEPKLATDRAAWQALEHKWIHHWIPHASLGEAECPNVQGVPIDCGGVVHPRAMQGFV